MLPKLNINGNKINTDKLYNQYAYDVINGKIVTNIYIKQACERYISWFERDDIYFDEADVDKKIRFMNKIKHAQGPLVGDYFNLYPYQAFITANIIGWKWKEDGTRVINTALLMLARKSGKTFFAAALMLAIIMTDGEQGAEGYMIANSAQQAGIAFKHAVNHCKSLDPSGKLFTRYRSQIRIPLLNSHIQILSSDTNKLDGLSPSIFICDEAHSYTSMENYDVLRTGQGARKNPCAMIISSAGFLVGDEYPLYAMWQNAVEVLKGTKKQDTLFAMLYMLEEEDDYKDESTWIKANPTLGGSISYKFLREQVEQAVNNPGQEVSIKTKNFNIWCTSETTWIPREILVKYSHKIDFKELCNDDYYYCYSGIDLGSVSDLSAIAYMVRNKDKLYFKCDCYIPDGSIEKSKNKDLYRKWIKEGYLKTTHGPRANYQEIAADIFNHNNEIPIYEIAYDAYNSQELNRILNDAGLVMTVFKQTKGNFNAATKEFERRLYNDEIVLDDNPVIRWAFANAKLEYDSMENCKPVKGQGSMNKIDPVIAIIQCFGTYLKREENFGTISTI